MSNSMPRCIAAGTSPPVTSHTAAARNSAVHFRFFVP